MKTKTVAELPKCDFCGKEATFDAPTAMGPWANMCNVCYGDHGVYSSIGIQFIQRTPSGENKNKPSVMGKCLTSAEDMVYDSIQEIECPECGEVRSLEIDARGTFTCEDCGIKVKIPGNMFC